MIRVCLLACLVALGVGATSAHAATTVVGCGYPSVKYSSHPSKCTYSADGSSAGTAYFERLKWKKWGKATATATGYQSANHREDDGTLARYRTTVQASGRDFCNGKTYYTQLRFKTSWPETRAHYSEWFSVRTPCG